MPDVVGIRFKPCGKIYDFEINGLQVKKGDYVVVESDFGLSIGRVVRESIALEAGEREFKKVLRLMDESDIRSKEENVKLEKDARSYCLERIMARGLPMKLVGAESTLDRRRIIFYFTADGRIDFRELVKDLAAKFKTRIEMRQIGVRDEAKLIGGLGICGRPLCCTSFLTAFEPVSIKMAKKQELALNVGKLSGLCSRLMCCLRYEYEGDFEGITTDEEVPPDAENGVAVSVKAVSAAARPGSGEPGSRSEDRRRHTPRNHSHRQDDRGPARDVAVEGQRADSPSRQAAEAEKGPATEPQRQRQSQHQHPRRHPGQQAQPQQQTPLQQPQQALQQPGPAADGPQPEGDPAQQEASERKRPDGHHRRRRRFRK